MRELIISDVHERIDRVLRIRAQAGIVDHTHYLGDFMDTREWIPDGLQETAQYLEAEIPNPANTFYWGNHDLQYAYPRTPGFRCSGFDAFKLTIVAKAMSLMRDKAIFTKYVQGWQLSHAGWAQDLYETYKTPGASLDLATSGTIGSMLYHNSSTPKLLRVGYYRGGNAQTGGITWLDWDEEFIPVPGLSQIVGHTTHDTPQWKEQNLALDTKLKHYAIIEDGNVIVHEVKGYA